MRGTSSSHVVSPSIIKMLLFSFHSATVTLIDCRRAEPPSERLFVVSTLAKIVVIVDYWLYNSTLFTKFVNFAFAWSRVGSQVERLWVGSDPGSKSDPCPSLPASMKGCNIPSQFAACLEVGSYDSLDRLTFHLDRTKQ